MSDSDVVGLRLSTLETQQRELCAKLEREQREMMGKLDKVHDAVLIMQNRRIFEGGSAPLCEQHAILLATLQKRMDDQQSYVWRITGGLVVVGVIVTLFAPNIRAVLGLGGP